MFFFFSPRLWIRVYCGVKEKVLTRQVNMLNV